MPPLLFFTAEWGPTYPFSPQIVRDGSWFPAKEIQGSSQVPPRDRMLHLVAKMSPSTATLEKSMLASKSPGRAVTCAITSAYLPRAKYLPLPVMKRISDELAANGR